MSCRPSAQEHPQQPGLLPCTHLPSGPADAIIPPVAVRIREELMTFRLSILSLALLAGATYSAGAQQVSDDEVKIGSLNDQSGVYADFGGEWSYEAARMAVEDFGGKVKDMPVEVVTADHQNKPDKIGRAAGR